MKAHNAGLQACVLLTASFAWSQPRAIAQQAALKNNTVPAQASTFKIAPQTFRDLEKHFDSRLAQLVPDAPDPVDVLGLTRGVYVEDCGVVFTAEVSLMPIIELNPFRREIPKELADRIHNRRVERLPLLQKAMDNMLHAMAMTFMQIPPNQRVVLAVRLLYSSWENTAGMPAQIMMSATRAGVQTGDIKVEVQ